MVLLVDAVRSIRDLIRRTRTTDAELCPTFQRPASMPSPEERGMEEIMDAIEALPYRPARIGTQAAFFRDNGPDAIGGLLTTNPQVSSMPHLYPSTFRPELFTGSGGEQIAAMRAMHDHPGPALVICHGLLMTKSFDAIIQIARRAYEQWGFHVVTMDLRGWGQSAWTTSAPSSAGFHEGADLIEICRELHRSHLVTSVGALGYSLGGATVMRAAHLSSLADDNPLDGGGLAVSAPTDMGAALEHISTKPSWRDPGFGLWQIFRSTIRSTVRYRGMHRDITTWRGMVQALSLPWYGVSYEQFCADASVLGYAHEITVPVLDIHAEDDFLIPVEHARRLREVTADNPNVQVLLRDAGAHVSFGAVDPRWYHSTLRHWFEYWATPGEFVAGPPVADR
jgi:predicted alpha/beta-fold hydrolase